MKKVKLAKDLPTPRKLTDEELEECNREGRELSKRLEERTRKMEEFTGEDMAVIIK
jgi:hypothetical protein